MDTIDVTTWCKADWILRLLWRRWTTHIVWLLGDSESLTFGELKRRIGAISKKVLTQRLRRMESEGLIERCPMPGRVKTVSYRLTDLGRDINRALRKLEPLAEHRRTVIRG